MKQGKKKRPLSSLKGLRTVALFEGAKGLLVLLTGFGLLAMIHRDVHQVAAQLIQHLHLNPAHHYPRIFLDLSDSVTDARLWFLAISAMTYAVIRFVEAGGLWLNRRWAEWFGALTGSIYIPLEIYEVLKGVTVLKITLLVVNIWIVVYLFSNLILGNKKR